MLILPVENESIDLVIALHCPDPPCLPPNVLSNFITKIFMWKIETPINPKLNKTTTKILLSLPY
jgi:hypothetical protein